MADNKKSKYNSIKRDRLIKKYGLTPQASDDEIAEADNNGPLDFVYDEYLKPKGERTQKEVTADDMKAVDSALSFVGMGKKDTAKKLEAAAEEEKYPVKPSGEQMGPPASLASKMAEDAPPIVADTGGMGGGNSKRTDGSWTPSVSAGGRTPLPDGLNGPRGDVAMGDDGDDPMVKRAMFNLEQAVSDARGGNQQGDDKFEAELQKIRESFSEAKSNLESRELAHTLADALTKLGAGWYGKKTGADLSNIKVTEHDFAKDLGLIQNELQTNLADLRDRRRENLQKNEKAADLSIKSAETAYRGAKDKQDAAFANKKLLADLYGIQVNEKNANTRNAIDIAQLQESGRHNRVMEDVASDNADKQLRAATDGQWKAYINQLGAEAKEYRGDLKKAGNSVMQVMGNKNLEEEDKQAQIRSILVNEVRMSADRADKASKAMKGWVFQDMDQDAILAAMDNFGIQELAIKEAKGSQRRPKGSLVVFSQDDGVYGYMMPNDPLLNSGKFQIMED